MPHQRSAAPEPRYSDVWGCPAPIDDAPELPPVAEPALRSEDRPRAGWDTPATPARAGWFPTGTWLSRPPLSDLIPTEQGFRPGHAPSGPAHRRARLLIPALLVPCALAVLIGVALLWPSGPVPTPAPTTPAVHADVAGARTAECGTGGGSCLTLVLRMVDGPMAGRDLVKVEPVQLGAAQITVGARMVLSWSGDDPADPASYRIIDVERGSALLWPAVAFALAVLLLGRRRGFAALAALALSFVVLLVFVLPSILAGNDPLAVTVVGASLIMFAVLYLIHGLSARTSTAVLGALLSLALIGILGAAFTAAAELTGLDNRTSDVISSIGAGVDARGLLLAGVVIGALGVLADVTGTQSTAVWELHRTNPLLGRFALFIAALRIGRDHVASSVTSVVLAYAGASLPLLLLFTLSGQGLGEVLAAQDVATEVMRTLVGGIGLVASVPITTAVTAVIASREPGTSSTV